MLFFFFNDTATTEIYTLSLHDALPIFTGVKVNPGTTLFCDGQASTQLGAGDQVVVRRSPHDVLLIEDPDTRQWRSLAEKDRKSTRLNSSHAYISYAVFCLKKN